MSADFSSLSPPAPGSFPQPASLVQASLAQSASLSALSSLATAAATVDRRVADRGGYGNERRQFGSSHSQLSPAAQELAEALDRYKLQHHRRYITCEEILSVVQQIGYRRPEQGAADQ